MRFNQQHLEDDGYEEDRRMHAAKDAALFEMKRFIITFGPQHAYRVNGITFDCDSVAVIKAENHIEAIEIAFDLFSPKFGTSYTEEQFDKDNLLRYFSRGKFEAN